MTANWQVLYIHFFQAYYTLTSNQWREVEYAKSRFWNHWYLDTVYSAEKEPKPGGRHHKPSVHHNSCRHPMQRLHAKSAVQTSVLNIVTQLKLQQGFCCLLPNASTACVGCFGQQSTSRPSIIYWQMWETTHDWSKPATMMISPWLWIQ